MLSGPGLAEGAVVAVALHGEQVAGRARGVDAKSHLPHVPGIVRLLATGPLGIAPIEIFRVNPVVNVRRDLTAIAGGD